MAEFYGTRADLLPRSMVKVVRAPVEDPRLLMWAGRPGVRLLDFHQHQRFDQASLQRFPRERDGSIAWASVPRTLIVCAEQDNEQPIRSFLREDDELVIMWGSLSLPSMLLNATEASARVSEILATDVLLWLYRPGHRLLLERNYVEDTAVVAQIPGD